MATVTNDPKFIVSATLLLKKLREVLSNTLSCGEVTLKTDIDTMYIAGHKIAGHGKGSFSGYTTLKQLNRIYNILTYIEDQPITLILEGSSITINGIMI